MEVQVCANSLESALNAQKAGADTIELCGELGVGGLTPSYGLMKRIREAVRIPVHVLIRPRSGDFTYSENEFSVMKEDIACCVSLGFDGVVCGVLDPDFNLDAERTAVLRRSAAGLQFTFHRAFDWLRDPLGTLSQLEAIGVDCILSSGQCPTAVEGLPLLLALKEKAVSCRIMPGAGIDASNAGIFKAKAFEAIHLSAIRYRTTLGEVPRIPLSNAGDVAETRVGHSDAGLIRRVVKSVK